MVEALIKILAVSSILFSFNWLWKNGGEVSNDYTKIFFTLFAIWAFIAVPGIMVGATIAAILEVFTYYNLPAPFCTGILIWEAGWIVAFAVMWIIDRVQKKKQAQLWRAKLRRDTRNYQTKD